ncbi:MAG: hypothetical protein CR982_05900 [Candidatus Cloacimonadota bacterium]|nr:MAG: hypothetical protein CR982_05900 [Candidatus Cloacimonadota bacterium]PIE78053.1 MAG: hypothetical protein CSA15_09460 [Candidatus Delongbacteria bacterium]
MKLLLKVIIQILFIFFVSCTSFQNLSQKKAKILDFYFTDQYDNRIKEYDPLGINQKYIYLVLVTENAVGKKVTLEIFDEPEDTGFIYEGKYIYGKIDFKIQQDKQKLKLYIYDEKNRKHRHLKKKAL